jgi:N-acetylornithine carbamoyltransferase
MAKANVHFDTMKNWSDEDLTALLDTADLLKSKNTRNTSAFGKVLGLLFFNPSLRTRVSFEVAAAHFGATTSIISPGQGSWTLETRTGAVMDGNKTEHIKEAVQVLSRYCDAIGVRAFSTLRDRDADESEFILNQIIQYADVPVINLESAMEHPCQGMADWMTFRQLMGKQNLKEHKLVLTWAPHPSALPQAVPLSVLEAGIRAGLQVTLACPEEMIPSTQYMHRFNQLANIGGIPLIIEKKQSKALSGADIVYAKSWASGLVYENPLLEKQLRTKTYRNWTLDGEKMSLTNQARFMHCLPVRRNVVVTDHVLDAASAAHIQQAENRLHVQKAILMKLWNLSF